MDTTIYIYSCRELRSQATLLERVTPTYRETQQIQWLSALCKYFIYKNKKICIHIYNRMPQHSMCPLTAGAPTWAHIPTETLFKDILNSKIHNNQVIDWTRL